MGLTQTRAYLLGSFCCSVVKWVENKKNAGSFKRRSFYLISYNVLNLRSHTFNFFVKIYQKFLHFIKSWPAYWLIDLFIYHLSTLHVSYLLYNFGNIKRRKSLVSSFKKNYRTKTFTFATTYAITHSILKLWFLTRKVIDVIVKMFFVLSGSKTPPDV